jgi:hypothetical protein
MKNLISKRLIIALLAIVFVLPVFSFAGDNDIYVDADASGTKNGSSDHPYKTIGKALSKANKKSKVHVAEGTYKENIVIPGGVEIVGADETKVIIEAKDDDEEVVKMHHKTELNNVTVRGGRYGIKVSDYSEADIIGCIIENNDKDGIKVKKSKVDDDYIITVKRSIIRGNERAGFYAERSRISLIDNEIYDNDSDGIDLDAGVRAWIEGNRIKNNEGSGFKMTLDGSEIWTKKNTYKDNDREGVEIDTYGGSGRIDLKKSKYYKNDRYGIARVSRGSFSSSIWNGLTFTSENIFYDNDHGEVSPIIILR